MVFPAFPPETEVLFRQAFCFKQNEGAVAPLPSSLRVAVGIEVRLPVVLSVDAVTLEVFLLGGAGVRVAAPV